MPSEAHHGQSGALRRSFEIPQAQAGWTKCLFLFDGMDFRPNGNTPLQTIGIGRVFKRVRTKKGGHSRPPVPVRKPHIRFGGGILPVILR
ncbi:hypothetical protein [Neisseria meningitidis]|uniref:hypothetical protein n=1 Tax=Neisseria meningitidis TaxID=487 RepID=UPI0002E6F5AB|nr:hypothetical protein [Neisseria meningitidis]AOT29881.1 hypothetical protein AN159_09020 [Neisseria meningitidis]